MWEGLYYLSYPFWYFGFIQERRAYFFKDAHLAGHLVRPCFLLQTRIEDVSPEHVASLEKFVNQFYSFPNKRAEVTELKDPAKVAIQEWTKLLHKSDEYSQDAKLWSTVPEAPVKSDAAPWLHGKLELQWWMLCYCSEAPACRALFGPIKMLYTLRVSELSSEWEFSVAEDIVRQNMKQTTHKSLCQHIRWFTDQRFRKEKRRREEEDPEQSDTNSEAECDDEETQDMEVEEVLDVLADGLPETLTRQQLADLAILQIKELVGTLGVGSGGLLMSRGATLPVLELLMEQVVTQASLSKLAPVIKLLTRYSKEHPAAMVKLRSRKILDGWRTIYTSATCTHPTAAAAVAATEAEAALD